MGSASSLACVSWVVLANGEQVEYGVIQEAGLGYKNDEKEDGLPAQWQWGAPCEFGTFHPLGLALVRSQHIKQSLFIGYTHSGSDLYCV